MTQVLLNLGSNIEPKANILKALTDLEHILNDMKTSSFYKTKPWGFLKQNHFLNMSVMGATSLSPEDLLIACQSIELKLKRKRLISNGPRSIDIDILMYGDFIQKSKSLTLPHPGMLIRDFMLIPSIEIAPELIHPVSKKPLKHHITSIEYHQIVDKLPLKIKLPT